MTTEQLATKANEVLPGTWIATDLRFDFYNEMMQGLGEAIARTITTTGVTNGHIVVCSLSHPTAGVTFFAQGPSGANSGQELAAVIHEAANPTPFVMPVQDSTGRWVFPSTAKKNSRMTPADLIQTLANLGHPNFTPTDKRPRDFGAFLAGARFGNGDRDVAHIAASNGPVLVCVALRPSGKALWCFVETNDGQVSGPDLAPLMVEATPPPATATMTT